MEILHILYGLLLVVVFIGIIIYFYLPKMKDHVEGPKYQMLEDDENTEVTSDD